MPASGLLKYMRSLLRTVKALLRRYKAHEGIPFCVLLRLYWRYEGSIQAFPTAYYQGLLRLYCCYEGSIKAFPTAYY